MSMKLSSPSSPAVPVLTLTFSGIISLTQAIQKISEPRDIYIFTPRGGRPRKPIK